MVQIGNTVIHDKSSVASTDARYTAIDLFAGVGGLGLGAARAGFRLALSVESDLHAVSAHKRNFPNSKHLASDIASLEGSTILKEAGLQVGELDGLIGGPPCQGFSAIGKRNIDDPRNNLFEKFFELVSECRPKFFVVENVPGILHRQYDDIRNSAFQHVKGDYALLDPIRLKASDFGAPTSRERAFFIGFNSDSVDTLTPFDFTSKKTSTVTTVGEALQGLPDVEREWLTEDTSWRKIGA